MERWREEVFESDKMNMSEEAAKEWIAYCDTIDRLKKNKDFQLFMDVYTRHEVMRLSGLLTENAIVMSDSKKQIIDNIVDEIKATSLLRNYINNGISKIRMMAEKKLEDIKMEQEHN